LNLYDYVNNDPINSIDIFGLKYAEQYAADGAMGGFAATAVASVGVDAVTGGINVAATPGELALGSAIGGAIGYGLGWLLDKLTGNSGPIMCPMSKRPARNRNRVGHRGGNDAQTHEDAQGHSGREKPNFTPTRKRPQAPQPQPPPPRRKFPDVDRVPR
jgi:hypothetical protein